jgi:hypothetical protein
MEDHNNTSGIHCKVSCNDQFRRFLFNGTEFNSLYSKVQQVLDLNKEFVLKYKDNEGDLISISSNEELFSAQNYSEGNVLRLTAVVNTDPTTVPKDAMEVTGHGHGRCRGGKYRSRGGRGRGWENKAQDEQNNSDFWKEKLVGKRDMLQNRLAELAQMKELTPEQQRKQMAMVKKLSNINNRLDHSVACPWKGAEKELNRSRKWEKKEKKHREKFEKKIRKNNTKIVLSEETRAEIAKIKEQITLLVPTFKGVKSEIFEKRLMLKDVKISGGNTEPILKEIAQLKELQDVTKKQINQLKEKIRLLKYA